MNKEVEGSRTTYSQSRRILLLLLIPLPALLIAGRLLEFEYDWLPIVVTSLFALGAIGLGLTHETLVLDFATRQCVYATTTAGIFRSRVSFHFTDVVGCHFLGTIPNDTVGGREVKAATTAYYVYLLYRDSSGKLADQIEVGVYLDKSDAMAEANELIQRVGGKIYLTKDLPVD